jgi:hypothetical protein
MDNYIKQLNSQKYFGYTLIILSFVGLLFNRVFAFPFDWILVGIAVVGIFIGLKITDSLSSDKYKYLKQSGTKIQAKFLYVSLQATQTLRGPMRPGGMTSPFRPTYLANFQIVCEGIDPTNQLKKVYVSDNFTARPNLKITPDTTFRVYVDIRDSNVYWVDLSDVNFDNNLPNVSFPLIKAAITYRSYDGVNYQKV